MRSIYDSPWRLTWILILAAIAVLFLGCPVTPEQAEYDQGFDDGFALDEWYWDGYFDGWDTFDFTPIYYDDSGIPYLEEPPYDAGYYDGIWYAYNDGYWVDYQYAFIIGFSEGYDNAYWPDYLDFLATDQHVEYGHGGWSDGYHDGYSEGRVFGANDYEQNLPFDWLDALLDYEFGTDLYFDEIGVGTGIYGPVILYEYGVNPNTKAIVRNLRGTLEIPTIRSTDGTKQVDLQGRDLYREFESQAAADLNVLPDASLRDSSELLLDTTWLERIYAWQDAHSGFKNAKPTSPRNRSKTETDPEK
jgi:hypothetical protein